MSTSRHTITREEFAGYTEHEIQLARSSDCAGNWKRLTARVDIDAKTIEFRVECLHAAIRRYPFMSDAILAYNAESG